MAKINSKIFLLIFLESLVVLRARANLSLGSCSLSCSENVGAAHTALGERVAPGTQGKRGPAGPKGSRGEKGDPGPTGKKGDSCDCSFARELSTQVETLKERINSLTGELSFAAKGWYKAQNNLWYKFFGQEKVPYSVAKNRCARLEGRLAAAGMRTHALRNEIFHSFSTESIWIGLDDLKNPNAYVWSDGVASTRGNTVGSRENPISQLSGASVLNPTARHTTKTA